MPLFELEDDTSRIKYFDGRSIITVTISEAIEATEAIN